jgi:hypothetical protein
MFDHYYTPREDHLLNPMSAVPLGDDNPLGPMHGLTEVDMAKPRPAALHTVVDLSTLALAFDCDSGSESGSDDGYVSTLLRIQRAAPLPATPRKIAGARRVARAASAPQAQLVRAMMDIDVDAVEGQIGAGMRVGASGTTKATEARSAPEGELFQSITATPGLESTSFEVCCISQLSSLPSPPSSSLPHLLFSGVHRNVSLPTPRQNCAILTTYSSFHIISMLRDPHPHPNPMPVPVYLSFLFGLVLCRIAPHSIPFLSPFSLLLSLLLSLPSSLLDLGPACAAKLSSYRLSSYCTLLAHYPLYIFAWISSYLTHPSTMSWSYRRSPISPIPHPPFS